MSRFMRMSWWWLIVRPLNRSETFGGLIGSDGAGWETFVFLGINGWRFGVG
jgi:hypothetical protein